MEQCVFNVGPWAQIEERSYGILEIPAKRSGQRCSEALVVTDMMEATALDLGEGRYEPKPILAEAIAQDIVRDHLAKGVFVAKGPTPTEDELLAAEAKLQAFCERQIEMADTAWARFGRFEMITDEARVAARIFGLDKPWLVKVARAAECEFCGSELKRPGLAKCPICGAVLDIEKAETAGLVSPEEARRLKAIRRKKTPKPEAEPVEVAE